MRGYSVADYHIHPDFSYDAEGSVEDFCQMALAQGLTEICFTTHYDTNPVLSENSRSIRINGEMHPHSIENFKAYVEAAQAAHEQYYQYGLSVRCGVEVGYYPGCEEEIKELFKRHPFYYKLGSVHEVDDYKICYEESMEKCSKELSLDQFIDRYFELLRKMIETDLFDAVGHLDRYRTYGKKYFGKDILTAHKGRIEPIFELMKSRDMGYELNTLAIELGEAEYYPSMNIINMARAAGTRLISIGSDAHEPAELSRDFEMAVSVAHELYPYTGE